MNYEIEDLLARRAARSQSFGSKPLAARSLILDEDTTLAMHRRFARYRRTGRADALLLAFKAQSARAEAHRDAESAAVRDQADA